MSLRAGTAMLIVLTACGGDAGEQSTDPSTPIVATTISATTISATTISATTTAPSSTIAGVDPITTETSVATPPEAKIPGSRRWILFVADLVREQRPGPPMSARWYAYAAVAYDEGLAGGPEAANEVTRQVLNVLLPGSVAAINDHAERIAPPSELEPAQAATVAALVERIHSDGAANTAAPDIPVGPGQWVSVNGQGPANPSAGSWQRWIVPAGASFAVPPPPRFDSPEYGRQLAAVQAAVDQRDAVWTTKINRWGGAPGTQAPAGIWLDRLWEETQERDDVVFARQQSILARTIADAFMECWSVKFTYWTARPDMVDPTLDLAMANPPFPAYVSGHSTISAAAATVLGVLVPDRGELWLSNAAEARDSRLYAGIHFPVDNEQGFALGRQVGIVIVKELGL